jgi:hypothetical protein
MQDRTCRTRLRMWRRGPRGASVVTVACLLAAGCTAATTTTRATPPGSGAVTATLPATTWQGTFQVDGLLTDGPAHVGSAGCTAIGRMALDLHRVAGGMRGSSVGGRLRVWAVVTSGTTDTACGRRDSSQGSLLGTLSGDGNRLQAASFHLLGVAYGWLTATIAGTTLGPTMQAQFGAGRSHHRSLRGTFTLARSDTPSDAAADSQQSTSPSPPQGRHRPARVGWTGRERLRAATASATCSRS